VRLLDPPEPLDHVTALLPDHPPRRFGWRGRVHDVVRGDGPERIHGEWWRRTGEADAVRDYFQVEDGQGARYWIYRRGDGEQPRTGDMRWHVHGIFA
jgi:protein ImuB